MRTCIGTGAKFAKRDLVRLVMSAEGRVEIDETGKRAGSRGAYVSKSLMAARQAVERKKLEAEFERPLDPADAEVILAFFERYK
jgi:uncharacterized protein